MTQEAIGGYFELELPLAQGELYPQARRFQSARAAFAALLMAGRPSRIWMPWYNCETMLEPPEMAGVPIARYRIDTQFEIADDIVLGDDEWLLYVNYFGISDTKLEKLFARIPRERIVIDNSQALFAPPADCLATLYSPRKFFGIPDGGYLITSRHIPLPDEQDMGSIGRFEPLLMRIDQGPEAGYDGIRAARATLRGQRPKRMSALTQRMLAHIDYRSAVERRLRNYALYHALLGADNALPVPAVPAHAPLCYPFWNHRADLHAALAAQRIFVAKYWPNMRGATGTRDDLEYRLATECLALPCDQRYDIDTVERVVAALREAIAAK
ncbi:hypothetical protein [Trinickia fusca]|uniref:DegT/DnrJ/EryC1/StrS aminotransferase family protein n=1 Tax=Trinickia fusca TaxID=2419777 RepID=A0A494X7K7_9BURK|nr:hypothetical protein [Trinickia fusca]RKP45601.1 hypothetical protein D7S89_19890 [Trinickia fusca]